MNWLDIVLIVVVGASVIAGLVKGITKVGIGLLAMIAGLLCGLWFYGMAGSALAPYIDSRETRNILGFLLIFIGVILLGGMLSWALGKLLKWVHLSWMDRLLGGVFGLARGVLIASVIIVILMGFTPKGPPRSVVQSQTAPYVLYTARAIVALAPHDLKEEFHRSYQKAKEIWAETVGKRRREPKGEQM